MEKSKSKTTITKTQLKSKSKTTTTKAQLKSKIKAQSTKPQTSRPRPKKVDLGNLFGNALQLLTAKRQDLNALDEQNGNHGDNMVANLRLITEALQSKRSQPPTEALQHASQMLQSQGVGGSSQYYANGLQQAADQFQGRSTLTAKDVQPLLQTLLGAIPAQGYPQQQQAGGSVLDQLLGMQVTAPQPQEEGGTADVGDVLTTLLPVGLTFLQAKQAGADTTAAAGQAVMAALAGGQGNPLQAGTPRAAAGGLIIQGLLQALLSKK